MWGNTLLFAEPLNTQPPSTTSHAQNTGRYASFGSLRSFFSRNHTPSVKISPGFKTAEVTQLRHVSAFLPPLPLIADGANRCSTKPLKRLLQTYLSAKCRSAFQTPWQAAAVTPSPLPRQLACSAYLGSRVFSCTYMP